MIETINYNVKEYPQFQSQGFAAQFAIPFARHVCKGVGLDIGCNREEWKLPGSIAVDPVISIGFDATNLPKHTDLKSITFSEKESEAMRFLFKSVEFGYDYIFSSHCLEHLPNWVSVLDYWIENIKPGGTLFLYLPDYSQEYWRPWNNRKHLNVLTPVIIRDYFMSTGKLTKIFVSGIDLNNSFIAMAEVI